MLNISERLACVCVHILIVVVSSRLPPIKPFRRASMGSHTSDLSSEKTKTDFFLGQ